MERHPFRRMMLRCFGVALIGSAFAAGAAQLDFVADAVVGKPDFATATGAASATTFGEARGIVEDPITGALWVAVGNEHRVLRFASAAAFANGEAANLVLGQANFTSTAANRGGPPAANSLSLPFALAVDQAGRVYVGDGNNNRVVVYRPPLTNGMDATWVIGQPDLVSNGINRGGAVAADSLSANRGVAVDRFGNLYVADSGNNRVLRFDAPVTTGASASRAFGQGNNFLTSAATTTASGLSFPIVIAFDGSDNLWVADVFNNRILRYDQGATTGDTAADLVLGQALFTTSTPGTSANTMNGPSGVAIDPEGLVYVVEFSNNRILRFTTLANGASATAVIGQASFTGGGCNQALGVPSAATLCNPQVAISDRTGNLIVGESGNHRVLRFDLPRARVAPAITTLSPASVPQGSSAFILTVNGNGFYGNSLVNWNGSPRPTSFISGKRLLAQIAAADVAGAGPYAVTVANAAPGGGTSTLVNYTPYARAALDATADRVLGQPDFISALNSNPQIGEEQVGPVNAAVLSVGDTMGIAVDPASGRLFVADRSRSRVQSWPSATAFYNAQPADVVFGQPDEFSFGCNTGGVSAASLCPPYAIAVDPAGAIYVSDVGNHRVLKYSPPFSTGMPASRVFGQGGSFTTNVFNNGGVSANSLSEPRGIAVNASSLFVHDSTNRRVLVYNNPSADFTADVVIGQADMVSAAVDAVSATRFRFDDGGLALDSSGRLYLSIAIDRRVVRFSPPFANNMAADLVIGQADFVSTAPAVTANGLGGSIGIAIDAGGSLLVSDFLAHRVLRYAAPLTSAMSATGVLGQTNFTSSGIGTSATTLKNPIGIAVDPVGNVFVSDFGNGRILAFDRPFALPFDPAADSDADGIPNGVELVEGRNPYFKDNDVFTNNRLFAMQQYRDFLGREGDAGGITFYTNLLTTGPAVRANLIESFFNSPEFSGTVSPIVRLYFATFLRIPDYPGLQFQINAFKAGTPLTAIATNFTLSPEFQATYGALSNPQYVALLYTNILGRTASQPEIDFHVNRLNTGASRGDVLVGFSESPEYQSSTFNKVYVTMMYVGMLHRAPEQSGYDYWVNYMNTGNPGINLILGFLNSPEYHNRFLP